MTNKVTETAPERIWLQVSDQADHDKPFPEDTDGITWWKEQVTRCEVEYRRADLPHEAEPALKPFNLEAALRGEPVVTGDGRPVTRITTTVSDSYPVVGVVDHVFASFTEDGVFRKGKSSAKDLFMALQNCPDQLGRLNK